MGNGVEKPHLSLWRSGEKFRITLDELQEALNSAQNEQVAILKSMSVSDEERNRAVHRLASLQRPNEAEIEEIVISLPAKRVVRVRRVVRAKELTDQPRIQRAPGWALLRMAEVVLSPRTIEHICEPAIADWNEEFYTALEAGHGRVRVLFLHIRHTWGFFSTLGILSVLAMVGKMIGLFVSASK